MIRQSSFLLLLLACIDVLSGYPSTLTVEPVGHPSAATGSRHVARPFHNGRPRHGFLGEPNVQPMLEVAPDEWFVQRLTHFDDSDLRTWKQRYFVNKTSFRSADCPVFINIGGEGRLSPKWVAAGHMVDMAEQHGALVLALEHRFYGDSHPLPDLSDNSLRYLSSEQALADLAAFRQAIVKRFELSDRNKWITFGGSYPGALSAWFRLKYPHLAIGAVASSAPIHAQLNFPQYLEVATRSLASSSENCVENVHAASKMFDEMAATQDGLNNLTNLFKVCEPVKLGSLDVNNFASYVAGNFFGVVQYNKDNRKGSNITIDMLCSLMNSKEEDLSPLERYATVNDLMMDASKTECLEASYENFVDFMRQTDFNSTAAEGGRQWMYQTCTEFGYYQTTDSPNQVFGSMFPLSFSLRQCEDIFGLQFNATDIQKGIDETNTNYGGYNMAATKIIFPNGSIDPWHALSFIHDPSKSITAIYIEGTAHCANMYPSSPTDLPALREARIKIETVVSGWLQEESS